MLIHLKLENFKIWSTTGPLRLAPVTLLLGTNSSGKSSLIQSLLLIRQTIKSDDPNLDLDLGNPDSNDTVTLGQFKDLLCRHGKATEGTKSSEVGIEFRWSKGGSSEESSIFTARYKRGTAGSSELTYLRLGKEREAFTVSRVRPRIYRLSIASEPKSLGQGSEYRPQRSFAFSASTLNKLGLAGETIKSIGPTLLDELGKIIYLGPVRRLAKRDYVWGGRMPANIGDDGAKAIDALIASGVASQSARKRKKGLPEEAKLFEETKRWLNEMGLADDLSVQSLGNSARYELRLGQHGQGINIKDVGVGVSQVLPVIVAALFAKPGHIVIIEEPESHLHPLAQSVLAELFSEVSSKQGVQFIIETHSEHLFRRMQTLIAKKERTPENTAMYFVERQGGNAQIQLLKTDILGRVENWPKSFFGDSLGETRKQTQLAIEHMKKLRVQQSHVSDRH